MSRANTILLCAAVLVSIAAPAAAQGDGNLASVTYWTVDPENTEAFEAGLQAHNQLHADQGDPVALITWQAISGSRNGQYGRGSFDHEWADFDLDEAMEEADTADSAIHLTPYIEAAEPMIWASMPEISNPAGGPQPIARIYEFRVRPGHAFAFEEAVGKIHAALMKHDWPHYEWYVLVDGGRTPTYAAVVPRENWAGFAPGETSMMEAVAGEYGDDARSIFEAFGATVEAQEAFTIVYREDLSYLPSGGE